MHPSEDELEAIRHLINNKPEDDFCGLTSNEMHSLIYDTFDADSPLKINSTIPDQILDQLPFFRLTEEFLKIIQRDENIKLTPLGALPKKTLTELYDHRLILDEGIETGIHKLSREIDCTALAALHYNTLFAGLIKKTNGKLSLTKQGIKLLLPENRNKLFLVTLKSYTEKLAWSNMDGYPKMPIGNLGWAFTMLMLTQSGDTSREMKYYADKYLKAFPSFLSEYPKKSFRTPEQELISCYCLRTFERFLEWWGWVKIEKDKSFFFNRETTKVVNTPLLKEIFHFEN